MKKLRKSSNIIGLFTIIFLIYMYKVFGYLEKPERKLQFAREQISTIPDDYLELGVPDMDYGIENQDLRRILYSLNRGSLRSFPTLNEALIIMDNLESQFGTNFIRKHKIGTSFEGRPIEAYRIGFFSKIDGSDSENSYPNIDMGKKPAFLLTSMHHSREPAGLTTGIYFITKLMEDAIYKQDPASYFLLSNIDVWYVPFVNPDGYAAIERTRNYGIRKNQRKTCNSGRSDEDGVDINRNYDFNFENSLISKCDPQEYSGEHPFSEPETRAIRDLVNNVKNFVTAVNLHTFGDLWTIPWNCCKKKDLDENVAAIYNELKYEILISSPTCIIRTLMHMKGPFFINSVKNGFDSTFFTKSRNEFENASKYCFSSAARNPNMDYEASGEADDYLLATHNIISLSPEIGSDYFGFYPPQSEIFPIARKYYPQILAVASKSVFELSISAKLYLQNNAEINNGKLEFSLFNSGLSSICSKDSNETYQSNSNRTTECYSIFTWELLSSNCRQDSRFDPGNTQFGEYSAGFRYRLLNFKEWNSTVSTDYECNTQQLLISINKQNKKENSNGKFKFVTGFVFNGSIEPRFNREFRLNFKYKNSPSNIASNSISNPNFIIHTCIANIKNKHTDGICQCGFIKFPNDNSNSNAALIVHSSNSDYLCNQLYTSKNEFSPHSEIHLQNIEKNSPKKQNIIFLENEPVDLGRNLTYLSICIISVTIITIVSILYSVFYKKYYTESNKAINSSVVPVTSETYSQA
ncbi:carboxypeptidase secreted [Cryptosporidium sp. chipmunk genotype I]|uniref:carboxypeptidase secreted n=1 Tax=Cryptosporidium sp. chipmunk genotype I TaxID=1280935 RepID=UPI00351A9DFA|nr:carboxypeptidase secreted [Cryptosporidium sp. chipmunk genotype I]